MLRALNKDQAHFIALLAKVARMQRDKLLGNPALLAKAEFFG